MSNPAQIAYAAQGFALTTTGGNCTAYIKPLASGHHVLVTLGGEAEAPQSVTDVVRVGLYCDEHSEELDGFTCCDLATMARQIAARGWK